MTKDQLNTKAAKYSALIMSQIGEMFHDDCENRIDGNDFQDEDKLKAFIYAFSSMVPTSLYNRLTKNQEDHLSYNHIVNHLIFEFSSIVNDEDE